MRLPINFLLYLVSLAMLGLAIWLFVQATFEAQPLSGDQEGPSRKGFEIADQMVRAGRGLDQRRSGGWNMINQAWWQQFKEVNLIGVLPPEPETEDPIDTPPPPKEDEKPLHDIFLLVSLMYHNAPEDPKTHVVLRYRPDSGVQVPESVLRQAGIAGGGGLSALASPGAPNQPQGRGGRRSGAQPLPATPIPTGTVQDLLVHHVNIGDSLWEPYSNIKLVEVAEDARSASFLRTGVTTPEGEEPKPELAYKNEMDLPPEVVAQLVEQARRSGQGQGQAPAPVRPATTGSWIDVEETRQTSPGKFSISKADDQLIREDPQELLDQVVFEPYRSTSGDRSRNGLLLRRVDTELGRRFGVRQGDVLLSVNGVPVTTRSQAIQVGTKQYDQGVREFRVRMMTMGQIQERVYNAPDR